MFPSQPSLKPPNGEEESYLTIAWGGFVKVYNPAKPLLAGLEGGATFSSMIFGGSGMVIIQEFTVLLPRGFPGLLDRDSSLFLGFVICAHLVFLACSLLQHQIWANEGKRKSREPSVM